MRKTLKIWVIIRIKYEYCYFTKVLMFVLDLFHMYLSMHHSKAKWFICRLKRQFLGPLSSVNIFRVFKTLTFRNILLSNV